MPVYPGAQWVLSVPKRLRPFLHHNPDIAGAVLRIFLRAIRTILRRTSPGAPAHAQLGAVSFLHRFGSSLNPHLHFHLVVLDGVFSRGKDGEAFFHATTLLRPEHWTRLQGVLQRRVLRYFRTRGLLDEFDALDMLSWQGSGGFSIDASVRINGDDRAGIERLLRYCARPPFGLERLHALAGVASLASPDARLLYRFPKPTPDGRTEIILSPLQLLERLVAFVPPPRMHRHRYHGVLAPHAGLRAAVVAIGRAPAEMPSLADAGTPHPVPGHLDEPPRSASPARIRWTVLLARIYDVLPLLAPARAPPQRDFLLDQTPSFDPVDPEPVPDFQFDQSLSGDFDD